ALCGVGDYIRSGDVGTVAAIECGGCLWCTWDNPVTPELDEFGWCIRADEVAPADAAIAALSAPQPPAEAQPVAWQYQDRNGKWHEFTDESHRLNTIEDGSWPIRPLYAHPPPSAPVGDDRWKALIGQWQRRVEAAGYDGVEDALDAAVAAKSAPVGVDAAAVEAG